MMFYAKQSWTQSPDEQNQASAQKRESHITCWCKKCLTFWTVFGCSTIMALCLVSVIPRGELVMAAPVVGSFKTFIGRLECHNVHSKSAISQVDHRTVVTLVHADYCQASHIVVTRQIFGRTITITLADQAPAILRGVTVEVLKSSTETARPLNQKTTNSGGAEQTVPVSIQTNLTGEYLLQRAES
ncbi:MAG: hypothetical protein J2P36_35980, partial [Ktedonobacteraceae bacterium]|nr:hypothetical protein [Ktedonobacteraceae bacterium]